MVTDISQKNTACSLCPRECGANRYENEKGSCGGAKYARVARADLHLWEEPCISLNKGSGTVFFSGCSLGCVFCQNHEISHGNLGQTVTDKQLAELFIMLYEKGAENINLVNPTHYTENILRALDIAKPSLDIPIIWNSGGYEKPKSLKLLSGYIDIFLPDLKYVTPEISKKYSGADDYFEYAKQALDMMFELSGYPVFDHTGKMTSGVLVRHLILPSHTAESKKVIDHLVSHYDTEKLWVSFMSQYFPAYKANEFPEISRKLTTLEYKRVLEYAKEHGIKNGFFQDRSSSSEGYVPQFSDKVIF